MDEGLSVKVIRDEELSLWSILTKDHSYISTFYSSWDQFNRVLSFPFFNQTPIRFMLVRGRKPISLAQLFLSQSKRDALGFSRTLTSGIRGWGHAGQLCFVDSYTRLELKKLILAIEKYGKNHGCSFLSIDFPDANQSEWFQELGFKIRLKEKITIDLTHSETQLFKNMSRNCRRNIRKAEEMGVSVDEVQSKQDLHVYYRLRMETRDRLGVPVEPFKMYETAWDHLVDEDLGRLFLTRLGEKPLGGIFLFHYKDVAFAWSGATSETRRVVPPGHLTHWHIIRTLKNEGVKTYDLGERWDLQDQGGIFRFKKGLGATFTQCFAAEKVIKKLKYYIWYQLLTPTFLKAIKAKTILSQKFFA